MNSHFNPDCAITSNLEKSLYIRLMKEWLVTYCKENNRVAFENLFSRQSPDN